MSKQNCKEGIWGNWLPENQEHHIEWLKNRAEEAEKKKHISKFHPVILEFKELIDKDPVARMYITQMIKQIPKKYNFHHLKSAEQMLHLLNNVLNTAPNYNHSALIGTPFSAILIWTMGTPAGFAAFRNEKINKVFKKLLKVWSNFLNSKKSRYVLNDSPHGWKSEAAQKQLNMQDYIYTPADEYWGFKSWNDFFTRKLADGVRPVTEPDNNRIIVSGCDSTVYKICNNVHKYSDFWIKSQPYSLNDMLCADESVDSFVGGSVYQAFLNPFNYHRWHSPISGTIKKAFVKEGLYFSQSNSEGEDPTDQDLSQAYITHIQTRALIFIESDNPNIGLMCFMPVGMVEISSCIINDYIKPGYKIKKGEELGYFQFGGSTHCLIFKPGAIKEFKAKTNKFYRVGECIATAN